MSYLVTETCFPKTFAGILLGCSLLLSPTVVQAATTHSATLSWAANSESDLAGYHVYQGTTSGSYGPSINVGNTTAYTAQNLQEGLTYYFSATAYDTSGNESLPSLEVSKHVTAPPADTTLPTIVLTAPSSGNTVSGNVTLMASATDNVGVVGVQFHLNGSNLGAEDTTNGYAMSWDTTTVGNGTYTLSATARDAAGNTKTSAGVTVTVNNSSVPPLDTTPPSVTLTAPSNGTTVSGPVTLSASATDNVGVVGVQFHLNGANLGAEDKTNSYAMAWDTTTVGNGTYTLTATARDAADNTKTSAGVTVTVNNPSSPYLLEENFNDGNFVGWTVVDEGPNGGPSVWSASTGSLVQTSNVGGGHASNPLVYPGTFAYYVAGLNWTNYQASLTLRSDDNDALGVMFRYQNPQNYYLFSWDQQRAFRRLVKVKNGIMTLLAEDNVSYVKGQTYQVNVRAQGSTLEVRIDGTMIFSVNDTSHLTGTLAFYCWANQGSTFDDVVVSGDSGSGIPSNDVNGDIFWRNMATGDVALWRMKDGTIDSSGFLGRLPSDWEIAGTGDLDGDGQNDAVLNNRSTGQVAVWFMKGLTVASVEFPGAASPEWEVKAVDDMNGDGKADLLWRNNKNGIVLAWLMNGAKISSSDVLHGVSKKWRIIGVGDVDGNGTGDVVWHHSTKGQVAVWFMDGLTVSSVGFPGAASTDWTVKAVGDMDSDGKADLLWRNSISGAVFAWLMNGSTMASSGLIAGVPLEWAMGKMGDANRDGKTDIIWHNRKSGLVSVWMMDGLKIGSVKYPGGTSIDWQMQD